MTTQARLIAQKQAEALGGRSTRAQTVMRAWADYQQAIGIGVRFAPTAKKALKMAFLAGAAWHIGLIQESLDKARVQTLKESGN